MLGNDELADILPSKTVPLGYRREKATVSNPNKRRCTEMEEVDAGALFVGAVNPLNASTLSGTTRLSPSPPVSSTTSTLSTPTPPSRTKDSKKPKTTNKTYLFFEQVECGADNKAETGVKYFKCYHGTPRKTFNLTPKMKYSVNHMVDHLRRNFPVMYQLYLVLEEPPTPEEIALRQFSKDPEKKSKSIIDCFSEQTKAQWDEPKYEALLLRWTVKTDQPFDTVDQEEFRDLLQYAHSPSGKKLDVPSRATIKRCVMKLGQDTIDSTREMFSNLTSMVSISLDVWTSSNGYAFLAIVARFVNNEGVLEELLIDFRELHVHIRILAFVMDNASNNDTLIDAIAKRYAELQIPFPSKDARMRCMPHIIHLAALELLEGIGVISKEEKNAAAQTGYQTNIHSPRADPDDETTPDGLTDDGELGALAFGAIETIHRICRGVRASPQRRKACLKEAEMLIQEWLADPESAPKDAPRVALTLILDVRTRWPSCYEMLRRALQFRPTIDNFTAKNQDFRPFELTQREWLTIEIVCDWLQLFKVATEQMSTTSSPTLSSTIAVFRGLQGKLKQIIATLPSDIPSVVKTSLVNAHTKLTTQP